MLTAQGPPAVEKPPPLAVIWNELLPPLPKPRVKVPPDRVSSTPPSRIKKPLAGMVAPKSACNAPPEMVVEPPKLLPRVRIAVAGPLLCTPTELPPSTTSTTPPCTS